MDACRDLGMRPEASQERQRRYRTFGNWTPHFSAVVLPWHLLDNDKTDAAICENTARFPVTLAQATQPTVDAWREVTDSVYNMR